MAAINQRGVTLIEMIIVIVVLGIAATGLLTVMSQQARYSVDPMLKQQGLNIAKSYFDEMNGFAFPAALPCVAPVTAPDRDAFDDLCDFDTVSNETPWDLSENAGNSDLVGYQVSVDIEGADLGVTGNQINAASEVLLMTVVVTMPDGNTLQLSRFRANW